MPPNHSRRQLLAGVGAFALAGCTDLFGDDEEPTPTPSPSPSPTPEPEGTISVQGEGIPVDVDEVWERVVDLMAVDVEPPERVVATRDRTGSGWMPLHTFDARLVGVEEDEYRLPEADEPVASGWSNDPETVHVRPAGDSVDGIELALVYGFVRSIQQQQGWTGEQLYQQGIQELAVVDGLRPAGARYVETAYAGKYLETNPRNPGEFPDAPPEILYRVLDTYYAYHYLEWRLDDPAEIGEVYEEPPRTSEQLIHHLPPDHGPAPLDVRVEDGGDWSGSSQGRRGELFVRGFLQAFLDRERANEASTGWGNDHRVRFRTLDGEQGDVFVTRWDAPADADTFEDAMGEYLDERAESAENGWQDGEDGWQDGEDDLRFELERASEDVVALIAGPETFTEAVTLEADSSDVTVAVETGAVRSPEPSTQ